MIVVTVDPLAEIFLEDVSDKRPSWGSNLRAVATYYAVQLVTHVHPDQRALPVGKLNRSLIQGCKLSVRCADVDVIEQFSPCSIDVFARRACVWALSRENKTLQAKCKRLTVQDWTARLEKKCREGEECSLSVFRRALLLCNGYANKTTTVRQT